MAREEQNQDNIFKRKMTRRRALSTGAAVGGVVAGLVVGGAAGYFAGGGAGTRTQTVTQTQTVSGGGATATVTKGTTETVTQSATETVTSTLQQTVTAGSVPFQGVTVNSLQLSGPPADSLKALAPMIKQQLGITVNVVEYPYEVYYSKVETELQASASTYDFVWMDTVEMPTLAQLGLLQSVDDLIQRDAADLPPVGQYNPTQRAYSTYQGKTYGWFYSDNFNECWVRSDLFNDKTEQQNFEKQYGYPLTNFLTQPDWLMFNDVIAFFNRPPNLYGYVHPMTWPQATIPGWHTRWYTVTGKPEIDNNWNPWFDRMGDSGMLSLELLEYQMKFMPPGVQSMDNPDTIALFLQGKAAVNTGWDSFDLFKLEDPSSSKIVGKVVQVPPIGGPIGWANYSNLGHTLGITSGAKNRDATWAVIKFITNPQIESYRTLNGGQVPASSWGWQKFAELNPKYSNDLAYISSYVAHSAGVAYGPFLDALVTGYQNTVGAALAGQMDNQTALKGLADAFRKAYEPFTSKNVPNTINADIPPWTGSDYTQKLKSQIGM